MPTQQMRAIWHPTRARILELLIASPMSRSELVAITGGPLAKIVYHTRVLGRAGCIRLADSSDPDSGNPTYETA